jgi:hypothetical protein
MAYAVCVELPEMEIAPAVNMPGIGELTFIRDTLADMPRISDQVFKLLNVMSPALAPVYSLIRVLDIIIAIIDCVKAIPKSLPFNPQPLIECFTNLFEALSALVALLPPFAYIRLIVDIVALIRAVVDDMLDVFAVIDREVSQIKATIDRAMADNDTILLQIGDCAKDNLEKTTAGILQVFEAVAKIILVAISILDIIASVIPGPISDRISEWRNALSDIQGSLATSSPTGYPPLQDFVDLLVAVRTVLISIEQFGKAILGLDFTVPDFTVPTLENP